jgi:hypothetical protein
MRKTIPFLLVILLSAASLFLPAILAQETRRPAPRTRSGAPAQEALNRVFRNYERMYLDTFEAARQVKQTGRLIISTERQTLELELEPHDLRAENYRAEVTIAPGVTVPIRSGPVRTFKGQVVGDEDALARFTIDENSFEGSILTPEERYYVEPARRYLPLAAPSEFLFYKASDVIETEAATCGVSLHDRVSEAEDQLEGEKTISSAAQSSVTVTPKALAQPLEAQLATEADFEYVTALGGATNANNEILSIMNQVEGAYQRDIGLSFRIVHQHVWATSADPYATVDPVLALKEFTNYWNANFSTVVRDVAHMWTGKNLTNTAGVGWTGVVCKSPASAYSLSERLTIAPQKFVLPAHELGHNFGASHSDGIAGCANTIMQATSTDNSVLAFCPASQNAITTFINGNSSCLSAAPACTFAITPTSASFPASGGTGSIAVTADGGCAWTAKSNVAWITITAGASGTGNGTVSYSVAANTVATARTGTITVAGKTFTVTQAAAAACTFTITPTSASFPSGGGSGSVTVTTQAGCAWTAVSNAAWITVTGGASGTGNGTVSYTVAANTAATSRTGTLTIAGKTFTVTQAALVCSFSISPTSASFPSAGGTGSIAVTATAGCAWTARSNVAWITITAGASGTGNGTVRYSVAANTVATSRTGTLTVAGKTFTVTQAAAPPTLTSLTVNPAIVPGCKPITGTVQISAPAPAGGVVVTLSDTLAATTVPASVTIAAGTTTKTFVITTIPVSVDQTGNVTAKLGAVTKTAGIKVRRIGVLSVAVAPNPIVGGNAATGTVTLECPAAPGNIAVALADNLAATTLPSSIIIAAGAVKQTFQITTVAVAATQTGTLAATANTISKTTTVRVRPIGVFSLTLSPNPVVGGNNVTGTVTLERPAGPGSIVVTLSSNKPGVAAPTVTSITIPAGVKTGTFTVSTAQVAANTSVVITATANGVGKSATLTVTPSQEME